MSREIDTSDLESLEAEDLKYLHDRNQISTSEFAEALGVSEGELKGRLQEVAEGATLSLEERANTGTANTAGLKEEEYEQRLKVNNGLTDEGEEPEGDEDEEEEETSYEDMTNDQLRAELAGRELSTSGNKEAMVQRLQADDESEEEEEEEEEQE